MRVKKSFVIVAIFLLVVNFIYAESKLLDPELIDLNKIDNTELVYDQYKLRAFGNAFFGMTFIQGEQNHKYRVLSVSHILKESSPKAASLFNSGILNTVGGVVFIAPVVFPVMILSEYAKSGYMPNHGLEMSLVGGGSFVVSILFFRNATSAYTRSVEEYNMVLRNKITGNNKSNTEISFLSLPDIKYTESELMITETLICIKY